MNQYWFLDKSRFVGYVYTFATMIPCTLVDVGITILFLWWLSGASTGGSVGILPLHLLIGIVLNILIKTLWAGSVIAPAAWMVRRTGLSRRFNSAIIVLVYIIAFVAILVVESRAQVRINFFQIVVVLQMIQRGIYMAKIQFERACYMCVEEFNICPELYGDEIIEQKAFDIYWREKLGGIIR